MEFNPHRFSDGFDTVGDQLAMKERGPVWAERQSRGLGRHDLAQSIGRWRDGIVTLDRGELGMGHDDDQLRRSFDERLHRAVGWTLRRSGWTLEALDQGQEPAAPGDELGDGVVRRI